jgi:hypothetical protein
LVQVAYPYWKGHWYGNVLYPTLESAIAAGRAALTGVSYERNGLPTEGRVRVVLAKKRSHVMWRSEEIRNEN